MLGWKKNRPMKLLTKTTFIYLIFTFIAFFSSALFLTREADEFIDNNLDERFRKSEQRLLRYLEAGKPVEEIPYQVTELAIAPAAPFEPVYSDTLIQNPDLGAFERFRKKTIIVEADGRFYRADILKSVEDFLRLRDDVFEALVPAFILLAFGIVLFNYFLSGIIFKPFNRILELMRTYKVGQGTEIKKVVTSTIEFKKMQDLFQRMIDRTEHDYRHLKEYTENMAHEIQTPLAIIRNKSENLVADERVMQHHADAVKGIYDEANHLSRLGNTLNLLTKIENGEFNNAIAIASRPIIEKHVGAVAELAALKEIEIDLELSDDHTLLLDPHLFDVVMKNLLRNAISYGTPEGPLRIRTDSQRLEICNFGPPLPFPPSQLFQRFRNNSNRRASLGLGLSLVKKICELNGLRIDYGYREQQHLFTITRQ